MPTIDLDALRAARHESDTDTSPNRIVFGGEEFEIPLEAPADFAMFLAMGQLKPAFAELLGDEPVKGSDSSEFERFWNLKPSVDDLEALITHLEQDVYGLGDKAKKRTKGN